MVVIPIESLDRLVLEQQGNNQVQTIKIDCSSWFTEYPDATIAIMATRPNESESYTADTSVSNGTLSWNITSYDTYIAGRGTMQIVMVNGDGENVKWTPIISTYVCHSQAVATESTPPQPTPSWIVEVIQKANEILAILDIATISVDINTEGHLIVTQGDGTENDLGYVNQMTQQDINNLIVNALAGKQDTLESGVNIKTVNGKSLLGSGNLEISGGGATLYKHTMKFQFENEEVGYSLVEYTSYRIDTRGTAYRLNDLYRLNMFPLFTSDERIIEEMYTTTVEGILFIAYNNYNDDFVWQSLETKQNFYTMYGEGVPDLTFTDMVTEL